MKDLVKRLVLVVIAAIPLQANALPFVFTHTGVVEYVVGDASGLTSVGDVVTIEVIADNGGTDLISQVWNPVLHTVSATFSAGAYLASFVEDWYTTGSGFATDAAGNLIQSAWYGTGATPPSSTDNFGTGVYLSNVGVATSTDGQIDSSTTFGDVSTWSVELADNTASPVPTPATRALFGLGLAGLGWPRSRKQK